MSMREILPELRPCRPQSRGAVNGGSQARFHLSREADASRSRVRPTRTEGRGFVAGARAPRALQCRDALGGLESIRG